MVMVDEIDLNAKKQETIWVAHSLFNRCKTSGTTANISFLHDNTIYISCSGSCFGTLTEDDLAGVPLYGNSSNENIMKKPSKELPLHRVLYQKHVDVKAVIHTHSPYATLWSCLPHPDSRNIIPNYTPYLRMQLGKVVGVPYAAPGSEELFTLFEQCVGDERGYLLLNHGPVVGGETMMKTFAALEELEQSAWIACYINENKHLNIKEIS